MCRLFTKPPQEAVKQKIKIIYYDAALRMHGKFNKAYIAAMFNYKSTIRPAKVMSAK